MTLISIDPRALEPGDEFLPLVRYVSMQRQARFAEWWWSTAHGNYVEMAAGDWHSDASTATAAGLPSAAVSAPLYTSWIASWLFRMFGVGLLEGGLLRMRALRILAPDQDVKLRLRVVGRTQHGDRTRVELEASVEDSAGSLVAAGSARATVPTLDDPVAETSVRVFRHEPAAASASP